MINLAADESPWQTLGNIATAVGVVVAIVGVIVTLVFTLRSEKLTRKGQDIERQQAEASAARSEAAAALTEEYTRRVVEALETIAQAPTGYDAVTVLTRAVRWSMTHHTGDTYQLTNDGDIAAHNVTVAAHETMFLDSPQPQTLQPGEGLTFLALRSLATSDSTITVTWNDDDSPDVKTWRYPLPAK